MWFKCLYKCFIKIFGWVTFSDTWFLTSTPILFRRSWRFIIFLIVVERILYMLWQRYVTMTSSAPALPVEVVRQNTIEGDSVGSGRVVITNYCASEGALEVDPTWCQSRSLLMTSYRTDNTNRTQHCYSCVARIYGLTVGLKNPVEGRYFAGKSKTPEASQAY